MTTVNKPLKREFCAAGLLLIFATGIGVEMTMANPTTQSRILKCPETPNCVSSVDDRAKWQIDPIRPNAGESLEQLWARVQGHFEKLARESSRIEITERSPNYLKAVFISKWMRFRDDVEVELDMQAGVIQWRSASRLGRSDLGVNRRRLDEIRSALTAP
jgi:uncharacterized protein (DUF1499 family)